ncbi:MAG: NAD-dependent protein deacylase [Propionibacteriaceae bacterium]|jgi:NAD-dependent deacetylase|nr:NAD-dependent protein deacylase [Propionibacteriaceae bacterium]
MGKSLAEIIDSSRRIVFFGGAGVSTESGIPDFRSADGLYNAELGTTYPPETIISHSFFVKHPAEFYSYYAKNLIHPQAKPNPAHLALANLEALGRLSAVVTQNIDGLHQDAGSQVVYELHGSVRRNYCGTCHAFYGVAKIVQADPIPYCDVCGGLIKPDVVLYEESLNQVVMERAIAAIEAADTLIVGGTSLVVYPAAGLVDFFNGEDIVLINRDPTPADSLASCIVRDPIGQALSIWA